jgi:hypothetical protein
VYSAKYVRDEEEGGIVPESPQVKGLVQTINIDSFRYYLTRWIVKHHIPFSVVEDTNFQIMLKLLNGSVQDYLIKSRDTVRDWVKDEFIEAKRMVQEVLTKAISKIHISCDLWTSPNGYALCGIAAHFVGY